MNVLEQEIRWIWIASKDRPLLAGGAPFTARAVLRPNYFVDDNKPDIAKEVQEIGCKGECEKAMLGVLIHVRGHEAQFASRHEDAKAFCEDWADALKEARIN